MKPQKDIIIGIDTGGTFTDVICYDKKTSEINAFKVPSAPRDPATALLDGLLKSGYDNRDISQVIHGTTIASNAIVERDEGSIKKIAYLTTKGFEDIPFIQRIDRKSHYDLTWDKPAPLVKRSNTFGVSEKISYKGEVLEKINLEELKRITTSFKEKGLTSVAISFLFSYINPEHELIAERFIRKKCPEILLSVSSKIYPKWKEYERGTTTLADAFLKPILSRYSVNIQSLLEKNGFTKNFGFMKTNGGLMSLVSVENNAVHTLNSGPAAGVIATSNLASQLDLRNILTIDIGGTTCDISTIIDSNIQYITSFEIEYGIPIQIPMVDVNAIGAGGGSVAWIDKGGVLQVGPESMGSDPGPVCYNKGNKKAVTLTDAYIILGYLNPDKTYAGTLRLRKDLCEKAVKEMGEKLNMGLYETASSIVKIVSSNTARAIDVFMARRGLDPRDFVAFAFGGSGPMHLSPVLKDSDFPFGIIPQSPGVFSAFGLLQSDPRVDFQHAVHMNSTNFDLRKIEEIFKTLRSECLEELEREGYGKTEKMVMFLSLEMRYFGQNYELEVPFSLEDINDPMFVSNIFGKFQKLYEIEYGYKIEGEIIEIICARLTIVEEIEKITFTEIENIAGTIEATAEREAFFDNKMIPTKIYDRSQLPLRAKLIGPAIIEEETSTIIVEPGFTAEVGSYGEVYLKREN